MRAVGSPWLGAGRQRRSRRSSRRSVRRSDAVSDHCDGRDRRGRAGYGRRRDDGGTAHASSGHRRRCGRSSSTALSPSSLSASMAASSAWIGMRPLATSWPPDSRTAVPKGAAQVFSQTSTAAELPGSIAAATVGHVVLAEEHRELASYPRSSPISAVVEVGQLERLERTVLVLLQDQEVEHTDQPAFDEVRQRRRDLTVEPAAGELDHDPVDRPSSVMVASVMPGSSLGARAVPRVGTGRRSRGVPGPAVTAPDVRRAQLQRSVRLLLPTAMTLDRGGVRLACPPAAHPGESLRSVRRSSPRSVPARTASEREDTSSLR